MNESAGRNPERESRALDDIASALNRLADLGEKFYDALYPRQREPRIATVTVVKSPAERERDETIQGTEATLEDWQEIGPREKEFIKAERAKAGQGSK